jgi:predicted ribosome quality control (RQC) complex YloA/Tae2 family protein
MLLRKHLQGGRITEVRQRGSERIIEIDIEAQNELGFSVSRRLIVEIMAKHSNIVLLDIESGKIIDSIKRISIDVNRYRQLLPGIVYQYPPAQDKIPFREITADQELPEDDKALMSWVGGISPAISRELLAYCPDQHDARSRSVRPAARLLEILESIDNGTCTPRVYADRSDDSVRKADIPGKTGTVSQRIAIVIQDGDYVTAGFWVVIVLIIAFLAVFLINMITGKHMKNVRKW